MVVVDEMGGGEEGVTTGAWQYGTVPLIMLDSISFVFTFRLHLQHVAQCKEPCA